MMAVRYWSHCYRVSHPTTGASRKLLTLNKRILPDVLGGGSGGFCWGTWDQVTVYVAARIKAGLGERQAPGSQPALAWRPSRVKSRCTPALEAVLAFTSLGTGVPCVLSMGKWEKPEEGSNSKKTAGQWVASAIKNQGVKLSDLHIIHLIKLTSLFSITRLSDTSKFSK